MSDIIFELYETNNFLVRFCNEDYGIIDNIIAVLNESCNDIADFFEYKIVEKLDITIYPNREIYKNALGIDDYEDWMVGRSHEHRISILSPQNAMPTHSYNEMLQVVIHEIVHEINDLKMPDNNISFWLAEGIACYLANQYDDFEDYKLALENNTFPKAFDLMGEDSVRLGGYTYSPIYVKHFIECFGKDVFLACLADESKLNNYLDDSFERKAIESFLNNR